MEPRRGSPTVEVNQVGAEQCPVEEAKRHGHDDDGFIRLEHLP